MNGYASRLRLLACLVFFLAFLSGGSPTAPAEEVETAPPSEGFSPVMTLSPADAVVAVTADPCRPAGRRTGVGAVVGDGTLVVTAHHVAFEVSSIGNHSMPIVVEVVTPYLGEIAEGRLLASDREWDLAILGVPWRGHPSFRLAGADEIHAADEALVVSLAGFGPHGDGSAWNSVRAGRFPVNSVVSQHRVPVQIVLSGHGWLGPGWSGSPILSADGRRMLGCFTALVRKMPHTPPPGWPAQLAREEDDEQLKKSSVGPAGGLIHDLIVEAGMGDALTAEPPGLTRPADANEAIKHLVDALRRGWSEGQVPEAALEELESFLALRPQSAVGLRCRASWLGRLGKPEQAEEAFKQALALDPDSPATHIAFARFLTDCGRGDEAIEEFRTVQRLEPESPCGELAEGLMVEALFTLGRSEEAWSELRAASERHPENARLAAAPAAFLGNEGDLDAAIEALRKSLALFPENGTDRLTLASLLEKQGLLAEAESHLTYLVAVEPEHPRFRVHLAGFLARQRPKARRKALALAEGVLNGPLGAGPYKVELRALVEQLRRSPAEGLVGTPAPELVVEEGAGGMLAWFRGRPVVVAFVTIYSRPCVEVLLELKRLQDERGAEELAVVVVHDRTATVEEIEQFRKDNAITFPIVRVPEADSNGWQGETFWTYGVTALPALVLIDGDGKVQDTDVSLDELRKAP